MKTVLIMGAGGRDFHDFNVVYRGDPETRVAAFTAAQIPGIDDRVYPAVARRPAVPGGDPDPARGRARRADREHGVDEVVLAYSDLSHEDVMHNASRVLAAGADFVLLGPHETMLESTKPVIAVTAVRTGCGKSQTSRRVGQCCSTPGLRVALVRHPMPYGDLEAMRVQRFATLADIDAANPTVEEREEYEAPVAAGHGHVRGRRLRRDPRPRRGRGGRHHLGRRQQRLPVLRARPLDHGRRPAAGGARAAVPPGRGERPDGRRRRREQGRQRHARAGAARDRRRPLGQPAGRRSSRPSRR